MVVEQDIQGARGPQKTTLRWGSELAFRFHIMMNKLSVVCAGAPGTPPLPKSSSLNHKAPRHHPEAQEGGLKRSFANLGASDVTAAQVFYSNQSLPSTFQWGEAQKL